jgi:hypothetical protein
MVRHHIDLRVRGTPGGRFTGHVFTRAKIGDIESPLGEFSCDLRGFEVYVCGCQRLEAGSRVVTPSAGPASASRPHSSQSSPKSSEG